MYHRPTYGNCRRRCRYSWVRSNSSNFALFLLLPHTLLLRLPFLLLIHRVGKGNYLPFLEDLDRFWPRDPCPKTALITLGPMSYHPTLPSPESRLLVCLISLFQFLYMFEKYGHLGFQFNHFAFIFSPLAIQQAL